MARQKILYLSLCYIRHKCPPGEATPSGFSVFTPDGRDIATSVSLRDSIVEISASESVKGCKVRYAVNGDKGKSGRFYGARGNLSLRKAGHLPEWCYMFSVVVP